MFWLFDKQTKYTFIQLFPYYNKYKDSEAGCVNWLYNFSNDTNDDIPELQKIIPTEISYTICVKDNYIQYITSKETITFQTEHEFIKENDELNNLKLPYFKWKYTEVINNKMPNISIKNYDFYYSKVNFKIYKINNNKLFIIEHNNEDTKKYILEKNSN